MKRVDGVWRGLSRQLCARQLAFFLSPVRGVSPLPIAVVVEVAPFNSLLIVRVGGKERRGSNELMRRFFFCLSVFVSSCWLY